MRRLLFGALLCAALLTPAYASAADTALLEGRAVLPAKTFADGPVSGTLLGSAPVNGIPVPFPSQPVQGFSGAVEAGDGQYWVMPDNGYGSIENSADFNLRVYLLQPNFETALGGPGTVDVERFIQLHDPDHKIPFAIVHNWTADRVLTGADFDIESIQRAKDGTLWFGDEFGPFLIHTDETGKVLHAPYPLPDPDHPGQELRAAQNPFSEEISTLRVMNALRGDAQAGGDKYTPIVSPDSNLLADNDPTTFEPTRQSPPAGSGLAPASSELMSVSSLHAAGFKVVPYTVDDPAIMDKLIKLGVDGLISDRPDLARSVALADHVDLTKFDVEGHRGGRNLRPENTLPAMEAGLDNLVTTLETDNHLTKDGVPVLSHDPYIDTGKCRLAERQAVHVRRRGADQGPDAQATAEQVHLRRHHPHRHAAEQRPLAVTGGGRVRAAVRDGRSLHGSHHPAAVRLRQLLCDVLLDGRGQEHAGRGGQGGQRGAGEVQHRDEAQPAHGPRLPQQRLRGPHARSRDDQQAVAGVIEKNNMAARADMQSFDFRTLRIVHREFPNLQTVALWGDDPAYGGSSSGESGDGTNLQPQGPEANTRWLAGLYWPYRETAQDNPFRVQTSGGFEGMAIPPDGKDPAPDAREAARRRPAGPAPRSTSSASRPLATRATRGPTSTTRAASRWVTTTCSTTSTGSRSSATTRRATSVASRRSRGQLRQARHGAEEDPRRRPDEHQRPEADLAAVAAG